MQDSQTSSAKKHLPGIHDSTDVYNKDMTPTLDRDLIENNTKSVPYIKNQSQIFSSETTTSKTNLTTTIYQTNFTTPQVDGKSIIKSNYSITNLNHSDSIENKTELPSLFNNHSEYHFIALATNQTLLHTKGHSMRKPTSGVNNTIIGGTNNTNSNPSTFTPTLYNTTGISKFKRYTENTDLNTIAQNNTTEIMSTNQITRDKGALLTNASNDTNFTTERLLTKPTPKRPLSTHTTNNSTDSTEKLLLTTASTGTTTTTDRAFLSNATTANGLDFNTAAATDSSTVSLSNGGCLQFTFSVRIHYLPYR